jgi:hypothetical protein
MSMPYNMYYPTYINYFGMGYTSFAGFQQNPFIQN